MERMTFKYQTSDYNDAPSVNVRYELGPDIAIESVTKAFMDFATNVFAFDRAHMKAAILEAVAEWEV